MSGRATLTTVASMPASAEPRMLASINQRPGAESKARAVGLAPPAGVRSVVVTGPTALLATASIAPVGRGPDQWPTGG